MTEIGITATWIIAFVALAAGAVIGFAVGFGRRQDTAKEREALEQLRQEFDGYRDRVGEHFSRTSELFHGMTEHYRSLYQHLAEGATGLCDPDTVPARLALDSEPLLTSGDHPSETQPGTMEMEAPETATTEDSTDTKTAMEAAPDVADEPGDTVDTAQADRGSGGEATTRTAGQAPDSAQRSGDVSVPRSAATADSTTAPASRLH